MDTKIQDMYRQHLTALCGFKSASYDDLSLDEPNDKVIEYMEEVLSSCGFTCTKIPSEHGKSNLLACLGKPHILLSGHTDTVPCNKDLWHTDPYALTIKDGKAYGLGACDMKGYLALILTLAQTGKLKDGVGILATADEETSMAGALSCQEYFSKHNLSFKFIFIGEPTQNRPVIGHKGWMYRELIVKGAGAHSSNPSLGINALEEALPLIESLKALRLKLSQNPGPCDIPYPTLNLGAIAGGDCANRVMADLKLTFDLRPTQDFDRSKAVEALDEIVGSYQGKAEISLNAPYADIEPMKATEAVLEQEELLSSLTRNHCGYVSYCTEGSILQQSGPCVILGPGSIAQAHQVDEFIALQEAYEAYDIYAALIEKLLQEA